MSPTFQTLAPEIIILVLENLSDSATLLAAILSCRHVHNAVKPYIPSVLKSIAISQIISLLYDSYALYKILRSVHPAPIDLRDLRDQARFLTQTLVALVGVAHYCAGDLLPLELPLQQCDIQCTSIALNIADNIVQPRDSAIKSWANTLSSYNMTFRVVTVKAKLASFPLSGDVLQQYRSMIEEAQSDLNDQIKSPIVAHHLRLETSNLQDMVLREKRSIEQCLHICNGALEFEMTKEFKVHKGQPTVISSINELLPEERQGLT
ncbi:hypothetical protein HAV15_005058 [Penicillium sp. str. |nr:hypothetical protein HAV15_005058 [Penicillium sp. str. \